MDYFEREKLIRRISNRKLYGIVHYKSEDIHVIINDPNMSILAHADWLYDKTYKENKGIIPTLEESYEQLKEDGTWSDKLQKELDGIESDLKQLNSKLSSDGIKFKKAEQRAIKATIVKGQKRSQALRTLKNQLYESTLEAFCTKIKRRFLLPKILEEPKDSEFLGQQPFIDTLSVYYFVQNDIEIKIIREIARTDPWRLYWAVSKDGSMPLFPHSSVEMTNYQAALVLWSKVYDFAYESSDRPSAEVINDDEKFDAWYDRETARIDAEAKRNKLEQNSSGFGSQEVFLPADEEGAAEVYALNSADGRRRIASRQKVIHEKGEVRDIELPDIQNDIKMEANRLATQGVLNRSE